MLNFEEELLRFKPSLDVDEIEEEILRTDLTDVKDILFDILRKEAKEQHNAKKRNDKNF